jgi:hypothetical protein
MIRKFYTTYSFRVTDVFFSFDVHLNQRYQIIIVSLYSTGQLHFMVEKTRNQGKGIIYFLVLEIPK